VFAGCALLIACQRQAFENTALPQQRDTEQARAAGWTIDEMMKVRDVDDVRISPDGRQVLFAVRTAVLSGDQGQYLTQVYSANADGTNERPVTESNYSATGAEWSPDGRWIAFLSDRSGRSAGNTIWLVPARAESRGRSMWAAAGW
jgi:acylaminoacyl-peptidase